MWNLFLYYKFTFSFLNLIISFICFVSFRPPQQKISEKVLIPQEEYPEINFVGLLIGPRGNTLKGMEKDVSCISPHE